MQREPGRKARQRLEPVAVQNGGVMVARFDHDEEVERIGPVQRGVERGRRRVHDAAAGDLALAPLRNGGERRRDEGGERIDLGLAERLREARHLRGVTPLGDHRGGAQPSQTAEILRQERGPLPAETVAAVARRAMLAVEVCRVRLGQGRAFRHEHARLRQRQRQRGHKTRT